MESQSIKTLYKVWDTFGGISNLDLEYSHDILFGWPKRSIQNNFSQTPYYALYSQMLYNLAAFCCTAEAVPHIGYLWFSFSWGVVQGKLGHWWYIMTSNENQVGDIFLSQVGLWWGENHCCRIDVLTEAALFQFIANTATLGQQEWLEELISPSSKAVKKLHASTISSNSLFDGHQ